MPSELSTEIKQIDGQLLLLIQTEYADQWRMICDSGKQETPDGHKIPFIGDLCEEVYRELWAEEKVNLIEEAINRSDDDLYGYPTRADFFQAAWEGKIADDSLYPKMDFNKLQMKILDFLLDHQIFFVDYHNKIRNMPVKEVW